MGVGFRAAGRRREEPPPTAPHSSLLPCLLVVAVKLNTVGCLVLAREGFFRRSILVLVGVEFVDCCPSRVSVKEKDCHQPAYVFGGNRPPTARNGETEALRAQGNLPMVPLYLIVLYARSTILYRRPYNTVYRPTVYVPYLIPYGTYHGPYRAVYQPYGIFRTVHRPHGQLSCADGTYDRR